MHRDTSSANTVFSNFIWRFAERSSAQLVSFLVSVILARILMPEAYGTIALVSVFINVLQVFVDSGFGNALIQKKNADHLDFSTVFYVNIIFCIVLYFIMFFCAPLIASFYGTPSLIPLIRVLSLTLIISGAKNVQQAYVSRNMLFRKFFFSTLGGTVAAAVIGIIMALNGWGVWALVMQQLLNIAIDTLILWLTVEWRPQLCFSITRVKELFSYGWKLLVSSLIDATYNNAWQLVIGKIYSAADLAYYNRGSQLPQVVVMNINTSIDSVLLPAMSMEQDDKETVKNMTRRAVKTSTYIMAPVMMGLSFAASNVVILLLTEKWLGCVPYLIIFCISYMFHPIHTANLNAIKAMGRSDIFLKLEIVKKTLGIFLLAITMQFGIMAMAYSLLVSSFLSQIINSMPNKRLLDYGYAEQLKDILPNIVIAVIMGGCIAMVPTIAGTKLLTILVQVVLGLCIYVVESLLTKNDSFHYLLKLLLNFFNKK